MAEAVKFLDNHTARLITSNQVIQGPYNVVKELVENALDAGATAVDIKLENYGLDKITVKDNAKGIKAEDVAVMCKPGYSSKITDFSDLESLKSYGFRGEALASICCIAEVSITTKTEDDAVATTYKFDANGEIIDKSASHLNQGTLITVQNIYHHQPARRRILLNAKASANTQGFSKCGTMSKIRSFLGAVGVAWPFVRIFLVHGGSLVWKKQGVSIDNEPIKTALGETVGHNLVLPMKVFKTELEDVGELTAVLPTRGMSISEISSGNKSSIILIINKRVVRHKKIEDALMEKMREKFSELGRSRYPACVLEFKVNPEDLDVNLEPDKSKFLLRREKEDKLLEDLKTSLDAFYEEDIISEPDPTEDQPLEAPAAKRQKTLEDQETQESQEAPAAKKQKTGDFEDTEECRDTIPNSQPSLSSETDSANQEPNSNKQSEAGSQADSFTVDFFTPSLVLPNGGKEPLINEGASISIMQKSQRVVSEVNLSEPSSDDETLLTPPENSLLCTPQASEKGFEDDDFTFTEDDEAALQELEKLMVNPQEQVEDKESPALNNPVPINQADWSRGHVNDEFGVEIEGCKIMAQSKSNVKHHKKNVDNEAQRQALLASPCTQMGLLNLRAFNMFCKETRPKILKDDPTMGLCQVAPLLARLWKELPDDEKEHYAEMAEEHKLAKMKIFKTESPVGAPKKIQKKKSDAEKPNLCMSLLRSAAEKKLSQSETETNIEIIEPAKKQPEVSPEHPADQAPDKTPQPPTIDIITPAPVENFTQKSPTMDSKKKKCVKSVEIDLSLEQILKKKHYQLQNEPHQGLKVFGKWKEGWLVKCGCKYFVAVTSRMQEALTFRELMAEHLLPVKELKQPIICEDLSFNYPGAIDACGGYQSESLSGILNANGISVKFSDGYPVISHICDVIPNYGEMDLQEILGMLSTDRGKSLECYRPSKVVEYFKEKCRESISDIQSRDQFVKFLETFTKYFTLETNCPHNQPVFTSVYEDILKLSQ